jgi:4a-hydroxytetrahydrobiopterin dehydratase
MKPPELLATSVIESRLATMPGWELRDGKLHREYRFADFSAAFAFMTRVAMYAEQLDHHPDWSNVYNRVQVALNTHDAGGITELDFRLAQAMEGFASGVPGQLS